MGRSVAWCRSRPRNTDARATSRPAWSSLTPHSSLLPPLSRAAQSSAPMSVLLPTSSGGSELAMALRASSHTCSHAMPRHAMHAHAPLPCALGRAAARAAAGRGRPGACMHACAGGGDVWPLSPSLCCCRLEHALGACAWGAMHACGAAEAVAKAPGILRSPSTTTCWSTYCHMGHVATLPWHAMQARE